MTRTAKMFLILGLLAVVGMAFRVSWNALRDVAHTIGADSTAAFVYPLVVDGLMALALVATLALTGRDRRFALNVLAGYTAASLVLNYVHGLVPAIAAGQRARLADWAPANWALVLLATSLPVGSIFFGSDLVAKVLHHRPDHAAAAGPASADMPQPVPAVAYDGSVYSEPPAAAAVAPRPAQAPTARPRRAPAKTRARKPVTPARGARSAADLLAEARELTADWPEDRLTGEALRTALHVKANTARELRDALKAERAAAAGRPGLHTVPAPTDAQPDSATDAADNDREEDGPEEVAS